MDSERAKAVIESLGVIEVLYEGSPVWIESVKDGNAEVTYIESKERIEVPLEKLEEGKTSAE